MVRGAPLRTARAWLPSALVCVMFLTLVAPARAQVAPSAPAAGAESAQFVYRFRARDTLIQVSRRLLLQPQRWPELQARNGIRDPFNIPPDTPLRIPYSWLKLAADTASVVAVAGAVTRDGQPLAIGDTLTQGMRIATAADGSVSIRFADQSVVTVQKSSVLRLERLQRVEGVSDGHSAELRLESGRAETRVQPKRDVGRFEIVTPVAVSAVRGTQFRSSFDADAGNATTETLEGAVGVAASGGSATVAAGFGTRVETGGAVLTPVPLLPMPDLSSLPDTHRQPLLRLQFPPVSGAAAYRAQLAADADFRALLFDESSARPEFALTLPADGDYWLRARAIDALGIEGADATQRFTQHVLPGKPELLAPATGARLYSGNATLQWSGLEPVDRYHLQLARDAQFTDLIDDRQVAGGTSLALDALPLGTHYWRVAAVNERGEAGDWSEPRTLIRRAPAPTVEALRVDREELRVRWAVQPGEQYRLQVARNAGFARPLVDVSDATGEYLLRQPRAGTYYVRVQALPANGAADPFGEAGRFEVPIPTWLKVLLGATVVVPVLL
jgi:hypothetical protein